MKDRPTMINKQEDLIYHKLLKTSIASGSSYTSCQRHTAISPSAPYLNLQTSPITSQTCIASNPHSSTIKSVSITLTTGGSQRIGIEVNLQPTLNQTTVSSSKTFLRHLTHFQTLVTKTLQLPHHIS